MDHEAFATSPDFAAMEAALVPAFADPTDPQVSIVHAIFTSDPTPALDAPTSEIWHVTPKEGVELAEVETKLEEVVKALIESAEESGAAARASVAEKPGQALLLIGWTSSEVRLMS